MDIDETAQPAVLQHLYAQSGDYPAAIRTQRWVVSTTTFREVPAAIGRLAELQRLAKQFEEAEVELDRAMRALALLRELGPHDDYRSQRRWVIEQGFLLARSHPDLGRARAVFDTVQPLAADIAISDIAAAAGLDAARHIGDPAQIDLWTRRIEEREQMHARWAEFQEHEDARMERMRMRNDE